MKRARWILAAALLLAVAVVPAIMLGQAAPQPQPAAAAPVANAGVFTGLRIKDRVILKDCGSSFEITTSGAATPGFTTRPFGAAAEAYEIAEIHSEYIVLKNMGAMEGLASISIFRIPVYSVKAVYIRNVDLADPRQ